MRGKQYIYPNKVKINKSQQICTPEILFKKLLLQLGQLDNFQSSNQELLIFLLCYHVAS